MSEKKTNDAIQLHSSQYRAPVELGRLERIDDDGCVWVSKSSEPDRPVKARFSQSLGSRLRSFDITKRTDVLLLFCESDPTTPFVIDTIHGSLDEICDTPGIELSPDGQTVRIEAPNIVLDASQTMNIRCGQSTIALSKVGELIMKARHVFCRAAGNYKIKGGSVKIN